MKKYRIKTGLGYVCGFSKRYNTVQSSVDGKLFTRKSLDKFVYEYSGSGYGFNIKDCIIEDYVAN